MSTFLDIKFGLFDHGLYTEVAAAFPTDVLAEVDAFEHFLYEVSCIAASEIDYTPWSCARFVKLML